MFLSRWRGWLHEFVTLCVTFLHCVRLLPSIIHTSTLSPCAVESHPTPGDSRGSSSPSRSISGVSSHVADRGSVAPLRPLLEYSSPVSGPHTKILINKIEMVQRRAACSCHNDYKTIERACMSAFLGSIPLTYI